MRCLVGFSFALWVGMSIGSLPAQIVTIDDDFEADDPCLAGEGWICQGSATWISPDALPCGAGGADPACNFYDPPEGYVLITLADGMANTRRRIS